MGHPHCRTAVLPYCYTAALQHSHAAVLAVGPSGAAGSGVMFAPGAGPNSTVKVFTGAAVLLCCCVAALQPCRTAAPQACCMIRTATLPHCCAAALQPCCVATPLACCTDALLHCCAATLPQCCTGLRLRCRPTALLLCNTAALPICSPLRCRPAALLRCNTAALPTVISCSKRARGSPCRCGHGGARVERGSGRAAWCVCKAHLQRLLLTTVIQLLHTATHGKAKKLIASTKKHTGVDSGAQRLSFSSCTQHATHTLETPKHNSVYRSSVHSNTHLGFERDLRS